MGKWGDKYPAEKVPHLTYTCPSALETPLESPLLSGFCVTQPLLSCFRCSSLSSLRVSEKGLTVTAPEGELSSNLVGSSGVNAQENTSPMCQVPISDCCLDL